MPGAADKPAAATARIEETAVREAAAQGAATAVRMAESAATAVAAATMAEGLEPWQCEHDCRFTHLDFEVFDTHERCCSPQRRTQETCTTVLAVIQEAAVHEAAPHVQEAALQEVPAAAQVG